MRTCLDLKPTSVDSVLYSYLSGTAGQKAESKTLAGPDFLKTSGAKTLSPKEVFRLSEEEAFTIFARLRWPDTRGQPICPHCDCDACYYLKTRRIFKCAACRRQFSVTSGTILHSAKLQLRDYLAIFALFANAPKGISALQISRDVGVSYKTAFVILHKLREAIGLARSNLVLQGQVEIDGAYFGGYVRPTNGGREGRKPQKRKKKKCVLAMVQRGGSTVTKIIKSENVGDILDAATTHIGAESTVFADEHAAYDALHARYEVYRINHRWCYSDGIACTNLVESFNSRMRRGEIGQYHRISARYLDSYANEFAFRSDRKRFDNGTVLAELTEVTLATPVSRHWCGYWQRSAPI